MRPFTIEAYQTMSIATFPNTFQSNCETFAELPPFLDYHKDVSNTEETFNFNLKKILLIHEPYFSSIFHLVIESLNFNIQAQQYK